MAQRSLAPHTDSPGPASVRRVSVTLAAAAWWFFAATLTAPPAAAHNYLVSTDPADGQRLHALPAQVQLTFTEEVQLDFANVTVSVDGGAAYGALTEKEGLTLVVTIPPGASDEQPEQAPGNWEVAYRVVADDGHPVTGSVAFTVAPGSAGGPESATPGPASEGTAKQPPAAGEVQGPRVAEAWTEHPAGISRRPALLALTSGTVVATAATAWSIRRQTRTGTG